MKKKKSFWQKVKDKFKSVKSKILAGLSIITIFFVSFFGYQIYEQITLQAVDITDLPQQAHLVYVYDYDNCSGSVVEDKAGTDNATFGGNADFTGAGKLNCGVELDGNNDNVVSENAASQNFENITICAWVYMKDSDTDQIIVSIDNDEVKFNVDTTGFEFAFNGDGTDCSLFSFQTDDLAADTWHHGCVVKNTTLCTVYTNNVSDVSEASTGTTTLTGNVYMGTKSNNLGDFNGTLDEIYIWDTALIASEIATVFELTNVTPPPPAPTHSYVLGIEWDEINQNITNKTTTTLTGNVSCISSGDTCLVNVSLDPRIVK